MKISVKIAVGVVCVVALGIFLTLGKQTRILPLNAALQKQVNIPTPTPFQFQEMTIPFLRTQVYQSDIMQESMIAKEGDYTSYRVSYISEGWKIYGLLTIPTGDMPVGGWPAVIFVHGYIPPTAYKTTQQYAAYTEQLSKNGFVVFKPDLRGHDQSEGEPGGAYYSSDYVIDTLSAYDALSKFPSVHKDKIGLWGHSMAGNVLMRTFAARPTIPAVVIWAGAVYTYADMQEFGIQDGSYRPPSNETQRQRRRQRLRELYGDYSPDSAFWKQVAVTDYLKDLKGSLQIHHAVNDDVVSVQYSRNLMKLLDVTMVPHELFEYPDGGHNMTGTSFVQAFERTVAFYKEKLK